MPAAGLVLRLAQTLCLVLDVNRDLGKRLRVLPTVVRAEKKLCGTRKQGSDICPGSAAVAHVYGGQGLGWG